MSLQSTALRRGGARLQGHAGSKRRPRLAVRPRAADVEEVDSMTGMPITKASGSGAVTGYTCTADGKTWAYRRSTPNPEELKDIDVLCIHGLGSSSYCYREVLAELGDSGYTAYAPDWVGHGDSDKPGATTFEYDEAGFRNGLAAFVEACGIRKPYALVVHGFVLSQYALLYAAEHEDEVARLMILPTPLSRNAKLRPELAAFKNPLAFLRPKQFDGMIYNMTGSPYAMMERDALAYGRPYSESPAASEAVMATMAALDWSALLAKVDDAYQRWRKPTVLMYGTADPFLKVSEAFQWLEDKRTNIKVVSSGSKVGHMPQEDYAIAVLEAMLPWLTGEADAWSSGQQPKLRMTKKGLVG